MKEAYVINLKRRPDRLDFFTTNIIPLISTVNVNIVEAIDGRLLDLTDKKLILSVNEWNFKNLKKEQKLRGVIACCQSHMKCLEQIISSDNSHAIIFEDDCVICENVKNDIDIILNTMKIPEKFSIIYLNNKLRKHDIQPTTHELVDFIINDNVTPTAEAYVISKQFAYILLDELKKDGGIGAYDVHMKQIISKYYDKYPCYKSNCCLFKQNNPNVDSDIQIRRNIFI